MSEASTWAAALPSVLMVPAVPPGWRLVSMTADDIDADGDLDVVANDGSLDLIVWINDGTGRLNRRGGQKPSGRPQTLSGPGPSDQLTGPRAVAHTPTSVLRADSSIVSSLISKARAGSTSIDTSLPLFVSTHSPRGPPSSRLPN
jgi:hypothetical protein